MCPLLARAAMRSLVARSAHLPVGSEERTEDAAAGNAAHAGHAATREGNSQSATSINSNSGYLHAHEPREAREPLEDLCCWVWAGARAGREPSIHRQSQSRGKRRGQSHSHSHSHSQSQSPKTQPQPAIVTAILTATARARTTRPRQTGRSHLLVNREGMAERLIVSAGRALDAQHTTRDA
jgi:hypothetical protein